MRKPRKPRLAQHFLADANYRLRIVDALSLRGDDLVVEIGPGRGAMTELLVPRARAVVAIEVDPLLGRELGQKFAHEPKVEIVHSDFLAINLDAVCRRYQVGQCFIFGNLPYYITSPIIHHVLGFARRIRGMGLLVQREVANRLAAEPGTRDYGYLTVFTRLFASPRVAFRVPPGAFFPPPQVQSAFVCLEMRSDRRPAGGAGNQEFLAFLKQSFSHKRKKLVNNLFGVYSRERIEQELSSLRLLPSVRAEELSLEQFEALFSRLSPLRLRCPSGIGEL